jgi:putative transposon-encoded protein
MYILNHMNKLKIRNNDLEISDKIETLFEKEVTVFGNGAKIDCQKKYLGKKALVIILQAE